MPEKLLSLTCEKGNTNNLRIISKPHAYLQTITKTPVKFQKNRYRTVGGAAPTGGWKDRRMDGWKEIRTERWIGKNKVTPLFFEKAGNSKLAANVSWCFTPLCLEQSTVVTCHLKLSSSHQYENIVGAYAKHQIQSQIRINEWIDIYLFQSRWN